MEEGGDRESDIVQQWAEWLIVLRPYHDKMGIWPQRLLNMLMEMNCSRRVAVRSLYAAGYTMRIVKFGLTDQGTLWVQFGW